MNGRSVKVTQIAFPESVTAAVYGTGVYAARGLNPTGNAADNIFADSLASELATVTGDRLHRHLHRRRRGIGTSRHPHNATLSHAGDEGRVFEPPSRDTGRDSRRLLRGTTVACRTRGSALPNRKVSPVLSTRLVILALGAATMTALPIAQERSSFRLRPGRTASRSGKGDIVATRRT
jgi:hypothetical protein